MSERMHYEYLKPKPGSNYRQLFVAAGRDRWPYSPRESGPGA